MFQPNPPHKVVVRIKEARTKCLLPFALYKSGMKCSNNNLEVLKFENI